MGIEMVALVTKMVAIGSKNQYNCVKKKIYSDFRVEDGYKRNKTKPLIVFPENHNHHHKDIRKDNTNHE